MKLLVAKNERSHHRLRQKLSGMPTEQGPPTPTLWAILAAGTAVHTMAIDSNRLHHGTTGLGGLRPAMGNHRPFHQDGALHPALRKNRGRPGNHLCLRGMETPRPPH